MGGMVYFYRNRYLYLFQHLGPALADVTVLPACSLVEQAGRRTADGWNCVYSCAHPRNGARRAL